MDNVRIIPTWKKGATAYDRLSELALLARQKPEKFERFAIVYQEQLPGGNWKVRQISHNCDLAQVLGILALGADQALAESDGHG